MQDDDKIRTLEERIQFLEAENSQLKCMVKQQVVFGNKITAIVAEMDELLEKRKLEIETLTNQLLAGQPLMTSENDAIQDFSLELNTHTQVGYLEIQKAREIQKQALDKEFERAADGKFICPFNDICNHTTNTRSNLRTHIRKNTGEKPYICDFCQRGFQRADHCNIHMLTHPEMNGVNCRYCHRKYPASTIQNHLKKCPRRKRSRPDTDSE